MLVSYLSKRGEAQQSSSSIEDFVIGGRNTGALVLMLSMGATYFSTWTLLGIVWRLLPRGCLVVGFAVWTIFHGVFVWLFGTRIWLAGKTPFRLRHARADDRALLVAVNGCV
ncbi:MAG: hypothetical protein R2838_00020 [Caldilineaceae bacterium]